MAQAADPSSYIYEGLWMNWTKGSLRGLTLTLSPTHTSVLTNLLALLVAMCGNQFWTILRFTLHQIFESSPCQKNPHLLHNQQQVILRNSGSAIQAIRSTLGLGWQSEKYVAHSRALFVALIAVANTLIFWGAATLSDKAADAGPTVISRSPYCGTWNQTYLAAASAGNNPTNEENLALSTEYFNKVLGDLQLTETYAAQCYMNNSESDLVTCSSQRDFQIPRLYWDTAETATCPFAPEMCHNRATTILVSFLSTQPRSL